MALAYEPPRPPVGAAPPRGSRATAAPPRAGVAAARNSVSASQARAARRREALSNEQAVSAWLRELSGRTR